MPANHGFTRPDGNDCPAFYLEPEAGEAAPGVVIIQEWWGVNDQIERVAAQLRDTGFRALVPDLYRGERALDAAEAEHKMNGLDFGDAAHQDVKGAVAYLKDTSGKVGVIGFCMGGVLAALAAMHIDGVDAAVDWYGVPPDEAGDPSGIRVPFQGHFADRDTFFPPEAVAAFEDKLKAGGVDYEAWHYDADHAFGNEDWDHYDPDAAKLAWQRSMDFLQRHLT